MAGFHNLLLDLMSVVVTIGVGFIVTLVKKYIGVAGMKRIESALSIKSSLATAAVQYVEQVFVNLSGPEKFDQAAKWLATEAGKVGLKMTDGEIQGLIESAIKALKSQFGQDWNDSVNSSTPIK